MKRLLNIELSGIQKAFLWILAFAALILKILFDSLFLLVAEYNETFPSILRLIFSTITFLALTLAFASNFKSKFNFKDSGYDLFLSDYIRLLFFYIILITASKLLPNSIIGGAPPRNLFEIIYINSFAVSALILSLMTISFFFKWIWYRRFKWTKIHIKILIVLSASIILFLDLPGHFSHISPEEIKSNVFLMILSFILNFSIIIVTFFSAKKKEWIASLTLADKWKILGMSLAMLVVTILFFSMDIQFEGDGKLSNALNSLFPAVSLFGIATMIILIYSLRIFFAAMLSIPTSGIIERKTGDFNSLTYLNRIASQTIDLNTLIDTVTNLSLVSGSGSIAWADLIENNNSKFKIISFHTAVKLSKPRNELIQELQNEFYSDKNLQEFNDLLTPYYIESIPDFQNTAIKKLGKLLNVKSLIILPLSATGKRIGTIYLLHDNEYGFDSDFLTLLSAFSNNLNMAIENIRLLQDTIEKEKYKKELKIAREIEKKLLPQNMSAGEHYSIAGYTIPADEVGGDYYDIVTLRDGSICLLIGDVSGKGMSAAFYMVLLKGLALAFAAQVDSASDLLKKINSVLYNEMEKKMFITISVVKLVDNEGNITLARAGHMPFLIKNGIDTIELKPKGIGLGLVGADIFDKSLEEINYKMNNNDILLMYSDGAVELLKDKKVSAPNFLKQLLKNSVYSDSTDVLNEIISKIDEMKNEYKIIDDMTLVCLTYRKDKDNAGQ